jgi:hypothetical protein
VDKMWGPANDDKDLRDVERQLEKWRACVCYACCCKTTLMEQAAFN